MKKTIVIFCRTIDDSLFPFNNKYYWNAYLDLVAALKACGANVYLATDNATYKGGGLFSTAYTADERVPASKFGVVHDIRADLVFEKGGFEARDVMVLNPDYLRFIEDKTETYRQFGRYQPLSVVCNSKEEVSQAFERIASERIVVKEPIGTGGHTVYIGDRTEVLTKIPDRYPLLVQEFMDTSVGVKGLVTGMHDVRVEIVGGKIIGGTLRVPAAGELRANIAQGGSERFLYVDEIPAEAVTLAREIDKHLVRYPRHYAADFVNTPDGWKLVELNSKPGLSPVASSPQAKHIMESLAAYLVEICPSPRLH